MRVSERERERFSWRNVGGEKELHLELTIKAKSKVMEMIANVSKPTCLPFPSIRPMAFREVPKVWGRPQHGVPQ